jgi:Cytochrome c oxidase subunit IV
MADEVHVSDPQAEEAGETIHLPGPSYQPVVLAFGLTLAITGVVLFPILAIIGVVISVVALIGWIRDTRREISELPLEH